MADVKAVLGIANLTEVEASVKTALQGPYQVKIDTSALTNEIKRAVESGFKGINLSGLTREIQSAVGQLETSIKKIESATSKSGRGVSDTFTKQFNVTSTIKQVETLSGKLETMQAKISNLFGKGIDTSKAQTALDGLSKKIEEFKANASGSKVSKSMLSGLYEDIKTYSSEYTSAVNAAEQSLKTMSSLQKELNSIQTKASSKSVLGDKESFSAFLSSVDEVKTKYQELESMIKGGNFDPKTDEAKEKLKEFQSAIDDASKNYTAGVESMNSKKLDTKANTDAAKEEAKAIKDATKAFTDMQKAQTLDAKITNILAQQTTGVNQYRSALEQVQTSLRAAIATGDNAKIGDAFQRASAQVANLQEQIKGVDAETAGLGTTLKNLLGNTTLGRIGTMALGRGVMYMRQLSKEMVSSAVDIESSLAQLQVITGATGNQLDTFFAEGAAAAREYGTEVASMLDSVTTFSRLGYNLQDSLDFSRVATELSNVADVAVDAGTSGLTSILKAYQDESVTADHIADVLTVVGQKYAISASELLTAFERGGAALSATGTSFEKSAALFAAANAALQNPEAVGTAMKTVSARIRGAKSELAELGEEYEDVAEGFSKYRDELMSLTNVDGSGGVDIMLDATTNSYKDIYEIFVEISGVWDKLSDTTQARVAEILGGTRQLSVISSLITNIKDAEGAYEDATHAVGIAAEANAVVMDTTEKKVEQLKTSFQVLSRDVIQSDLTKNIVDFGRNAVEVIDNLVNKFGALPVALTAIGGFDLIKNLGKIYCPPREQFLAA